MRIVKRIDKVFWVFNLGFETEAYLENFLEITERASCRKE